ncbi:glycerophosphodiester phosphodiesterase family protein [Jannaschia aquimarina]|uniref:glycerophosphodiester phosphodiesterase n=1 Tax=Jannaschia aquimarina TaxID=935700 RepID=A0A0D1D8P4_9RHOB|nr:glycerophosphodiester phosphodiesterase family protein [Jannaschia aquimarina]KIT16278.1 glycerophosphodiester phosphodiesterase [Jannaschia aquimarina]SNT14736.1 glycerophosphoryl diester phosphodiesterase [Jannaschia aquimarina]
MSRHVLPLLLLAAPFPALADAHGGEPLTYGQRPFHLIDQLAEGELKEQLMACRGQTPQMSKFSIGHRGAPLMFPEHTVESNVAAARQGAGILECDVTFTQDHELVCRHAQNDLHTTTNILVSDLADTCVTPFTSASGDDDATAECRTSEITLAQYRTLVPKMDASDGSATTAEEYQGGTADWRTDLYTNGATIMTHAESIALFDSLGADFTPELKAPSVEMPHEGFSQEDYAQKLVDEYKEAGIDPSRVWLQSFQLEDVLYWIENEPDFGAQAVYLMDEYDIEGYEPDDPSTWPNTMAELKEMGVNYIAPPTWMLVKAEDGEIVPSALATEAKAAGLGIITWTLERSGPLAGGGGWYFQSIEDVTDNDGVYYELLHVLAQDVEIEGIFSDWPATVTYYANCFGL